jgi:ABC-type nitrate/sulfonate/bicarbonate transport system permease component
MTDTLTARVARRNVGAQGRIVQRLALVALVLAVWQLAAMWLDSTSVPTVAPIARAVVDVVPTDAYWSAVGSTMTGWGIGMAISVAVAIPLGLLIGASERSMRVTRGVIEFMRTVPSIMLVPLLVLVLGSTIRMKVVLIVLAAVWPLLVQASYGIRDVDRVARETATAFRLPWVQRVRFLYLPSALPLIATGLRVAATVALLISVGGEIVTSAPGIGYEISLRQANGDASKAFVYVLTSGVLGVAINVVFGAAERRAMFWHASQRSRAGAA